jgi:cell division protease FtsH
VKNIWCSHAVCACEEAEMPVEKENDRNQQLPEPRSLGSSVISLLMFLILFNFIILPLFRPRPTQVPYSTFLSEVKERRVAKAFITDSEIRYVLREDVPNEEPAENSSAETSPVDIEAEPEAPPDGEPEAPAEAESEPTALTPGEPIADRVQQAETIYSTVRIESDTPNLITLLDENGVEFGAAPPDQGGIFSTLLGWILPPLIFVGIWMWFLNRAQKTFGGGQALTVGKSKARIYSEGDTGVTFQDVAGQDEAKAELVEIVEFLQNPDKYTRLGAVIPKGVLLVGPPGTGKTLLAKAVAGEAGVPFFSMSGSEFIELFVGVGAARVRDLFQQAKQKAPCIVFIDELDALGKARRSNGSFGGNDEQEQTLNQLLTEMDGFEANTGVIILAATNRPEVLDQALRRPGRFDRQVVIDRPDRLGREAVLQVHSKKVKLAEDVNLGTIAARTPGFAGADLANLINEAALLAARKNQETVTMADLNEAIERVIAGLERKSRVLNQTEKTIVSYHEVGHAIVGSIMPGANKVEKISIVPRGVGALGYTLQLPEEDRFLMAEDEIRGRIATLLGGRSAEEVVFNKVSTGASDDIQKATDIAERMITIYGMDENFGPVAFERIQQQFIENNGAARRPISPELTAKIDRHVQQVIAAAHEMAQKILRLNRALLEETAQNLLENEILEGDRLRQFLNRVEIPSDLEDWLQTGKLEKAIHPQSF